MARLSIAIAHGLAPEIAKAKFQSSLHEARTRYLNWIARLDWSDDGNSATVSGPGFEVRCWCDERDLHIEGSIPLTWKLFESSFRNKIKRDIDRDVITHEK